MFKPLFLKVQIMVLSHQNILIVSVSFFAAKQFTTNREDVWQTFVSVHIWKEEYLMKCCRLGSSFPMSACFNNKPQVQANYSWAPRVLHSISWSVEFASYSMIIVKFILSINKLYAKTDKVRLDKIQCW